MKTLTHYPLKNKECVILHHSRVGSCFIITMSKISRMSCPQWRLNWELYFPYITLRFGHETLKSFEQIRINKKNTFIWFNLFHNDWKAFFLFRAFRFQRPYRVCIVSFNLCLSKLYARGFEKYYSTDFNHCFTNDLTWY